MDSEIFVEMANYLIPLAITGTMPFLTRKNNNNIQNLCDYIPALRAMYSSLCFLVCISIVTTSTSSSSFCLLIYYIGLIGTKRRSETVKHNSAAVINDHIGIHHGHRRGSALTRKDAALKSI
jgi:hypothetical protein